MAKVFKFWAEQGRPIIEADDIAKIVGRPVNNNMISIEAGLTAMGVRANLHLPARLCCYLPQMAHESGRFQFDTEVWDGRGAQARYDIRTDLGNTPERDGDGFKFRGRTGIQITGRANTIAFRDWCRSVAGDDAVPDFEENPDLMNTDPWEGMAPIWYWLDRDLDRYAKVGNMEMITRRINGGLNGYADRLALYHRTALILLGYNPRDFSGFQQAMKDEGHAISVDGQPGPQTRRFMHMALLRLPPLSVPISIFEGEVAKPSASTEDSPENSATHADNANLAAGVADDPLEAPEPLPVLADGDVLILKAEDKEPSPAPEVEDGQTVDDVLVAIADLIAGYQQRQKET